MLPFWVEPTVLCVPELLKTQLKPCGLVEHPGKVRHIQIGQWFCRLIIGSACRYITWRLTHLRQLVNNQYEMGAKVEQQPNPNPFRFQTQARQSWVSRIQLSDFSSVCFLNKSSPWLPPKNRTTIDGTKKKKYERFYDKIIIIILSSF